MHVGDMLVVDQIKTRRYVSCKSDQNQLHVGINVTSQMYDILVCLPVITAEITVLNLHLSSNQALDSLSC